MEIYVINLERDKERLEFALNQANDNHYKPLIISAVNGGG